MNIKMYLGKIPKVWLASLGVWSMPVIGWLWANFTVNTSFYYVYTEINLPSFLSTLIFLPISLSLLQLYIFLVRKYSETNWKKRIESQITKLGYFLIAFQIFLILGIGYIAGASGALDLSLDNKLDIIFNSFFGALPIMLAQISFALFLFLEKKKEISNLWALSPTIHLCGTLFFKIFFLLMGMES